MRASPGDRVPVRGGTAVRRLSDARRADVDDGRDRLGRDHVPPRLADRAHERRAGVLVQLGHRRDDGVGALRWPHELVVRQDDEVADLATGVHDEFRSNPAVAVLAHHDATLGSLRAGGFPVLLSSPAYSLLDAYVFGFVLTEQNLPVEQSQNAEEFVAAMELPADEFPHLAELVGERIIGGAYDFADEFDVGLEMILDQLETRLALERGA
ncbi:hypothetical protein C5C17_08990 [Pseudoclavibacter sp. RFBA6]|nr:hypothetical protein C5C17_08990 [Pseudoclavibacter sp. RFBA6]